MKNAKKFITTTIFLMLITTSFAACGSKKTETAQGTDVILEEILQKYQNGDFAESGTNEDYVDETIPENTDESVQSEIDPQQDESDTLFNDYADQHDAIAEQPDIIDVSDWSSRTTFPTQAEIDAYNKISTKRSPYMDIALDIPHNVYYTEFMVDIKSDHFPLGSYYSIGNWYMDFSSLRQQYQDVRSDYGILGYAGLQNIYNGDHICIMSMWDTYCTNSSGKVTTIRSKQIYPDTPLISGEFTGEGVGVQCLTPYEWEESHWYRAHLKCTESKSTGNTVVEYWMIDLETMKETLICAYDIGFKSTFYGVMSLFLENYLVQYSGDVRTMEIRNAKYLDKNTGIWNDVMEADMIINGCAIPMDYAGSCDFGVEDGTLWVMTTGVGNDHTNGEVTRLYLKYNEGF